VGNSQNKASEYVSGCKSWYSIALVSACGLYLLPEALDTQKYSRQRSPSLLSVAIRRGVTQMTSASEDSVVRACKSSAYMYEVGSSASVRVFRLARDHKVIIHGVLGLFFHIPPCMAVK
jgi:hypothetical protein